MTEDIESAYPAVAGIEHTLGHRRTTWSPDKVTVELELDERHLNMAKRVHGGIYATLIDDATGYVLCWESATERTRPGVTLNLSVEFIGAPTTNRLIATGVRKGGGKSIGFASAEVRDSAGVLLATGSATYKLQRPS